MASADDLLPRVDVHRLSETIRQDIINLVGDAVRDVMFELAAKRRQLPAGALKAAEAAAYLSLSRSKFYEVVKEDAVLLQSSFKVGKCRLWPIASLNSWIQARAGGI